MVFNVYVDAFGDYVDQVLWSRCQLFTLAEIQSATNNFDETLVIGRGGFGKVYKSSTNNLSQGEVAIKRLDSTSTQGAHEFEAEVAVLSKLSHGSLVSLIGYCNEEKEMILVYELMPKVKSSNILLDANFNAKISDFGLAKTCSIDRTHVSTAVKGTFGYMDPCYYNTGKLTRESDVYAFGVVLFEVLSGRKAVDRSFDDEEQWSLAGWAQEQIKQGKGKVDRIIDPRLMGQISKKCLKEFASLAGHCLHTQPKNRPTMTEVVMKLKSILSQELKSKSDNSVIDEEGFIKKLRSIFKGKVNAAATGTKSALIQLDAANRKNTNQNTSKS